MRDVRHGDASSANPMSSNQSECENGLTTVNREGRWYDPLDRLTGSGDFACLCALADQQGLELRAGHRLGRIATESAQ